MGLEADLQAGHGVERRSRRIAAALVLLAVAAAGVHGAAYAKTRHYDISPAPGWVEPTAIGTAPGPAQSQQNGEAYLLVDRQVRAVDGWTEYHRYVIQVVNPAGVQDASELTVNFDPQLDHLILHAVTVRRGAQVIDELRHGRIEVLQRESDLEQDILDGSLTFHLLMSDVRVGDIIDMSYTIEHHDPALGNRFFMQLTTRWDDPVARSRLRVLSPAAAPLFVAGNEPSAPVKERDGGWQVLEWNWSQLPGTLADSDAPSWYRQHAALEFSQFKDWDEVVRSSLPLFAFDARDPQVVAEAERLKAGARTDGDRALAALRFVQEKIRYTGLELGSGAFRPRPPGEVLRSRYGDCKDKALLAVALLRAMRIDAAPALVSTRWDRHLGDRLPSPGDFDHAIVRLRLGGKTYWIDVTETAQGGVLDTLDQADFGSALVIAPGVTALEPIPTHVPAHPLITATAVFDLRAGLDAVGNYTLSTVYRGSEADYMRRKLRRTTPAELGKGYLNYYKGRYTDVTAAGPPVIHDDPLANVLTVDESYRIAHPFVSRKPGERSFELEPEVIDDDVQAPGQPARSTPLTVGYPVYVAERITIRLPSFFPVKDEVVNIDHPAFHYESRMTHSGNDVVFDARYQTLADEVPLERLQDFLEKLKEVREDGSLVFTSSDDVPDESASAAARDALVKAMGFTKSGKTADADAAFTKLLAMPGFDGLTAVQQHAALMVAGAVAFDKGDNTRALDLLKRSCGMEQSGVTEWKLRVYAAQRAGDAVDAGYALATVASRWPDAARGMDFRLVSRVLHDLPDAGTNRYALLTALHQAKYNNPTVDLSHWWRDLALLQLERGDIDQARATAAEVTDPYALVSMRADNRFAAVRQHLPDVAADLEQRIQKLQAIAAQKPDELDPRVQLGYHLLYAGRFAEVVRLMDGAIATVNGPKGPKAYSDYATEYAWILDLRSQALVYLGRGDDAVAQLLAASHLPEVQGDNVSQVINLASLYDDLGRPQQARATLADLQTADMSPYGRMQATVEHIASADELGDQAEVRRQLAYASAHRGDSLAGYQQALISADRLDDASQLLISRLRDPSERIDALMEVQDYKQPALPPRARKNLRRWQSVIRRPDVRQAIDRVGNIGSYPLIRGPS